MANSVNCDCGGRYTRKHRATHMQTQRHTLFTNTLRYTTPPIQQPIEQPIQQPVEEAAFTPVVWDAIDRAIDRASNRASNIKKVDKAIFEPTNDMCAICMDPMTTKETAITSCNHRYCVGCFISHAVYGLTHSEQPLVCPICRAVVVAVAYQVLECDPYTKRIIDERDSLQRMMPMEWEYTTSNGTSSNGTPDVNQLAYRATLINTLQHRIHQLESKLKIAKETNTMTQTKRIRTIALNWNRNRNQFEDVYLHLMDLIIW